MPIEETIKPDWQDADIPTLAGGLDSSLSPENIDKSKLTTATNMIVDRDLLIGDLGYYPYKTVSLILSATRTVGATSIAVNAGETFDAKAGSKIALYMDDGSIFITTISSVTSGTIIIIADGLPSTISAGGRAELERYTIGIPMKFHRLEVAGGSVHYFMLTTETIYKDSSLGYWEPVGFDTPAATTLSALAAAGATVFDVTTTAGLAVGDIVRIVRVSGRYYVGKITAIAAGAPGTITCAGEKIAVGAANGAAVQKCVTLTGNNANKISAVSIPWSDQMMFTNGVDAIKLFTDSTVLVSDATGLPSAGNTKAKALAVFDSSVFLISTVEGGVNFKQRIRYCDNADITEWVARNAGYVDLLDTTKECLAGKILGPYLYIYRSKGIHRVSRSQRGDRRFDFDEMITNHGILSSDCIQEVAENQHAIFDDENIFLYTGGFEVEPIGDPVKRDIFGSSGILDVPNRRKSALLYVPELRALYAVFQAVGASNPMLSYRYSIDEKAWTTRGFPVPAYALGYGNQASAITWQTVQGIWSAANYSWDSAFVSALADTLLLGLGTSPNAGSYIYQQAYDNDAGSEISYIVQTKNFSENYEIRFDWLDIWCSGGTIAVDFSVNRGQSWADYGSITATTDIARYRLHKQFSSEQYMFRLRSTDPNFSILKLRARIAPETEQ